MNPLHQEMVDSYINRCSSQKVHCFSGNREVYHYHDDWIPFVPWSHNSINFTQRSQEEIASEKKRDVLLVGIGLIFGGAVFLGNAFRNFTIAASNYFQTRKIQKLAGCLSQTKAQRLRKLASYQIQLDRNDLDKHRNTITALFATIGGGCMLLLAALTHASLFFTVGTIAAVAGIAFGLLNMSYHWNDEENFQPLKERCRELAAAY